MKYMNRVTRLKANGSESEWGFCVWVRGKQGLSGEMSMELGDVLGERQEA
jgi:hypothetical protein